MHDRLIVGTYNRYVQVTAIVLTVILIMSLLPILYLGRYNHPTGDDYYYGAQSHIVWEETGSITWSSIRL